MRTACEGCIWGGGGHTRDAYVGCICGSAYQGCMSGVQLYWRLLGRESYTLLMFHSSTTTITISPMAPQALNPQVTRATSKKHNKSQNHSKN